MSSSVEDLAQEALALPADARVALMDRLVESLDPLDNEELRQLWAAEALRRRDEVRSGTVQPVSESDAADRVRLRLKRR
jgi:putative addiction module component (TIGR02574 family)